MGMMIKRLMAVLVAVFMLFAVGAGMAGASSEHDEGNDEGRLVDYLDHAETYYWISMAERGSLTALAHGIEFLEKAQELLEAGSGELREKYAGELEALSSDIHYQYMIAHDTLHGLFPLSRFLNPSLFSTPHSLGSFELFDEPATVAVREGVENLVEHVLEAQAVIPQFDVLFVSDPVNAELENEALYLFNLNPRFFVHNLREVSRSLTDDELAQCRGLSLAPQTREKLLKKLGTNAILLVRLREIDVVHGDYFYSAEGRLYAGDDTPSVILNNYGFAIDRRTVLPAIVLLHALLLLLAVPVYMVGYRYSPSGGKCPEFGRSVLFGMGGYLWGRVLVWMIVPIFYTMQPDPERIVLWSFWWPIVTGASLFVAPIAAIWVAVSRFNLRRLVSPVSMIAPVMLGSASFLVECLLIYKGLGGFVYALPLLAGIVPLAVLLFWCSRKDVSLKPLLGVVTAATCLLLLTGAVMVSLPTIAAGAGLGLAGAALFGWHHAKGTSVRKTGEFFAQEAAGKSDLLPNRQEKALGEKLDRLTGLGEVVYLGIAGSEGAGKSYALCRALNLPDAEEYNGYAVHYGTCAPSSDAQVPYAPFAEACRRHLPHKLFASADERSKKMIDDAVNKVFDSVVPFSKILFSSKPNDTAGSKAEIHIEIYNYLKRHSMKSKILFVIDDCHFMDAASAELLEFMIDQVHQEVHPHIKFVLLGREASWFPELPDSNRIVHDFPAPSPETVASIVERRFNIRADCARQMVEMFGLDGTNLKWALEAVGGMIRRGCFKEVGGQFDWKEPGQDLGKYLPGNSVELVSGPMLADPVIRPVLQCAACLGYTFDALVLGASLEMDRLELLQILDRVEQEAGWVFDLHDRDDQYRFRSTLVYEAIRERFGIRGATPAASAMPQLIREFHSRLGMSLEERFLKGEGDVYNLANQYYLAGARHADKAVEYCLQAAGVASSRFMHALAGEYCDKADEYGPYGYFEERIARTRALVACNQSHFDGHGRKGAVEIVGGYIESYDPDDFEMHFLMLRALFDAGQSERDQVYFQRCYNYGAQCLARFESPLDQAVVRQFMGLSLPLDRREDRRGELEKARELVGDAWQSDTGAARIYAKILNSLADELSRGSAEDKARSGELYHKSIELKELPEISDTMGLAMSYGGLGRLEFFSDSPDYGRARAHFEKDLLYSQKIGNTVGVGKMYSFLGMCDYAQGKWAEAQDNFGQSLAGATSVLDKLFALAGLLQAAAQLGRVEIIEERGQELADIVKGLAPERAGQSVISICRDELEKALDACSGHSVGAWCGVVRSCLE